MKTSATKEFIDAFRIAIGIVAIAVAGIIAMVAVAA